MSQCRKRGLATLPEATMEPSLAELPWEPSAAVSSAERESSAAATQTDEVDSQEWVLQRDPLMFVEKNPRRALPRFLAG